MTRGSAVPSSNPSPLRSTPFVFAVRLVLWRITVPILDHLVRMVCRLLSEILAHRVQVAGAHAVDAVSLVPLELDSRRGVALFAGGRRAGAFEALQHTRQARNRMGPREQVQVRRDH